MPLSLRTVSCSRGAKVITAVLVSSAFHFPQLMGRPTPLEFGRLSNIVCSVLCYRLCVFLCVLTISSDYSVNAVTVGRHHLSMEPCKDKTLLSRGVHMFK